VARRVFHGRVGARSRALMDLLGELDADADSRLGVMVASLVVRADTGMPGEGYFAFAEHELGRPIGDRSAFWEREVSLAWDALAPGPPEALP